MGPLLGKGCRLAVESVQRACCVSASGASAFERPHLAELHHVAVALVEEIDELFLEFDQARLSLRAPSSGGRPMMAGSSGGTALDGLPACTGLLWFRR